jgi:hypothetical protein
MSYTVEQEDNTFIVSNKYHRSIVTIIRFIDGNVLIFSAGDGEGDENAARQNEVRNAYENAKKQGLQAVTFHAYIWSPTFFQKAVNMVFGVFNLKPFDPKEKIKDATDFEITDAMQKEFGKEEFSLEASTVKLLIRKVFKISTFGLMDILLKKTIANTTVGKVLSILVTIGKLENDAYSIHKTARRDIQKEMAVKVLMFGFTLDPDGEDAKDFFVTLKLAEGAFSETNDMSRMTLEEALKMLKRIAFLALNFKTTLWQSG